MGQLVAHAVVRRPQRELRLLVDGVRDHAVCLIGPDGRISTWNAGAERMYGYAGADAVGRHLSFLYSDEDVAAGKPERALAVARAEGRLAQQVWQVRRGGRRFLADVVITAVRDDQGGLQGFANVTRDVTERHGLQRELAEAQKLEAVGCLAARAAHDFRNFLTGVRGYVDLALPKVGDRHDLRDDLRKIGGAVGRASKMVDQLLVSSRGEVLEPKVVDLRTAVRSAEPLVRHAVDVDVEVSVVLGDEPLWVRADPAQIERILLNLAMNARDAMPEGGTVTIDAAVADPFGDPAPGRHVALSVSDTGTGMDAAVLNRCFEHFFTTKKARGGTGLGLAAVADQAHRSGGLVRAESEPGVGARVSVFLPLVTPAAETEVSEDEPEDDIPRGRETVLLAEDDVTVREIA